MAKTSKGLVAYAKMALEEDFGYCLGTWGQTLTPALYTQKCSQGGGVGDYNSKHRDYLKQFLDRRVSDCYGIVKGYLWRQPDGSVPYVAAQDRNQEGAYNAAREKGPLATMPEIPGLVLWMKGHAGVYIGNGEFIECRGAPDGMKRGRIENGRVVAGSRFTHWFADSLIDYSDAGAKQTTTATPTDDFAANCDALEKAGIMNPAAYWKLRRGIDPNFAGLVANMAKKVKG